MTINAMGCQRAIAEKIVDKKANYILAVKENQQLLLADIKDSFQMLAADAVNLLKQEQSLKRGVKGKRLKAAWNHAYLLKLLGV